MKKTVELVLFSSDDDYRKEYVDTYVNNSFNLWGVPVIFDEKSFNHIFFEPQKGNLKIRVFSKRRAKRMYFMKAVLDDDIKKEVMFESDSGNFAIFCLDLECVVYLRNRAGHKSLQVVTFFDFGKDHIKMYNKQKRKCTPIDSVQLRDKLI
ncbi:MAG: hypothetical protein AUJ85_10650 [Elusimicrobia bacterium CG1_02_37_114]|nr:MAG: hypothetical protein AUJ85_10650 [Elusimicrobia bacterium CG1_02_37_114]PIV53815.1 MAG: hypothetical protein COS17_01895 [Elusimicrobia bacterium CG02_land_8_20_14_3_00_37_13]PIZ12772.1 MAG: hypothetical protein COY53_08290 [Elusimicrobia bacterium CG_4_10_14_0_8_um_filter_37_32]